MSAIQTEKTVELVFEKTCPNVDAARQQLRNAFSKIGLPATWKEWEVSDDNAPDYVRSFGSPTILVNGKDVSGNQPGESCDNCRIYTDDKGKLGVVPPVEKVVLALTSKD